jgi:hypothetical protein
LKFDVLIECKNLAFDEWWMGGRVIEDQLLPYKTLFGPKQFILASLKPIPKQAKKKLEEKGIILVDNFYPNGNGVPEFRELLHNIQTS